MATPQDASIGFLKESTYKTGVTVTRFPEYIDEDFDWSKGTKQGVGLRVGGRVARSARRVNPTAMGTGGFSMECTSKGMGTLWELIMGSATSTLVSGSTFQQVFTLGDTPPSATIQKGLPELGGSVDAYTFLGCMVDNWEFAFPNADIATLKTVWNIGDLTTATGYATPSYVSTPNLYHFANGTIFVGGTLTAPTTTALGASNASAAADIRGGTFTVSNNLSDGFVLGGAGRKRKPTIGLRTITGKMDVEYDSTTFRDAVLNDTAFLIVLNFTAGALSTGNETLQVIIPEVKFDSELAKTNGTDLIVQSMSFTGLDNLTAAQPLWVVMRTADAAL